MITYHHHHHSPTQWRPSISMIILGVFMIILSVQSNTAAIVWGTCQDSTLVANGAQCALLTVPLDYSKPNGETIQIALSRIKSNASANDYQGVMVISSGYSSLTSVTRGQKVPGTVGQTYDWIAFDIRGVGSSVPALSCDPNILAGPRSEYTPSSKADEQYWFTRSKNYANACGKKYGKILEHINTMDVARDVESIRIALGVNKINYYGYSYGTYIAQLYATLHPHRIRRLVLDSSVDPRYVWFQANLNQNPGFDRNVKIWFQWLAQYHDTFQLGNTSCQVEENWNTVLKKLKNNPIDGTVGPDEWLDAFLEVAYTQSVWIDYGFVFSDWFNNQNDTQVVALYEDANSPGDDNAYAAYLAIQATDNQWPRNVDYVLNQNWFSYTKAPIYTWENAWYNGPAQFWPALGTKPVNVDGKHVDGALLICETLDASKPFAGSLEVRRRFPRSSLVAVIGGTSRSTSLTGDPCIDNRVAAYLATGALPTRQSGNGPDVSCPALPKPNPTAGKK